MEAFRNLCLSTSQQRGQRTISSQGRRTIDSQGQRTVNPQGRQSFDQQRCQTFDQQGRRKTINWQGQLQIIGPNTIQIRLPYHVPIGLQCRRLQRQS